MNESKMWIGLHTGEPEIAYDDLGLRQRVVGEFARADVREDGSATWSAPTVTTPVAVELADGVFYKTEVTTGGSSVTSMCLADAPTGGTVRLLQPTAEAVVDDEGVTRQVWREAAGD